VKGAVSIKHDVGIRTGRGFMVYAAYTPLSNVDKITIILLIVQLKEALLAITR
jgi:hypothetical protein